MSLGDTPRHTMTIRHARYWTSHYDFTRPYLTVPHTMTTRDGASRDSAAHYDRTRLYPTVHHDTAPHDRTAHYDFTRPNVMLRDDAL